MRIYHFDPTEFSRPAYRDGPDVAWFGRMSVRLLVLLDTFRFQWNKPVSVSRAPGAVGRADASKSQHNVTKWGEVRAVDILPEGIGSPADLQAAFDLAVKLGFTGVGVYPHWRPAPGLHLDVREDRVPGDPATWGAVRRNGQQVYVSVEEAVLHTPT